MLLRTVPAARMPPVSDLSSLFGPTTAVVGHRGASAHAPENTVEAFRLARQQGADGIETDVRRTADNALVIHHDPEIDGVGSIVDVTLEELRRAAPWVPTIDEMLEACEGMWINAEIKNAPAEPDFDADDWVAAEVVRWVEAHHLHDRVIVSSFNPGTIDTVQRLDPSIPTGQLTHGPFDPEGMCAGLVERGHDALHPFRGDLADALEEILLAANARRIPVLPWTVDDPAEIQRFAEAGVAGVITNDPAAAVALLRP